MTWGKVDDNLAFHPKVLQAGNEAMGLWIRALSYSCQQLTDGFIPSTVVGVFDGFDSAERLVQSGLWHLADGGYQFNDWADYQPTRKDVESKRESVRSARSEAGKRGAEKRWNGKPDGKAMANEWQTDSPDPTRPVPDPLTVVNTNNVTVTESGRNDIIDINQLKLKAALKAEEMGLKDIPVIRNYLERVLDVRLTMDHTLELVGFILATAKGNVKNVDAYLVTVCKRNPEAIRNAWIQLDLVS